MILLVKVKPNAKKSSLEQQPDGNWVAHVNAPPVDGKANERLIKIIAEHFDVPKSSISIQTGKSSKLKRIEVMDR